VRSRLIRDERIEKYRGLVQREIISCPNCQPWEGGPVWVKGHRMDLREVLDNCRVPENEEFRDEVITGLDCPGCGDSIGAWTDVGVRHDFELEHEDAIAPLCPRCVHFESAVRSH
jgi:hypothetical protein